MTATQTRPVSHLAELVAGVRTAVDAHASWSETAQLVAGQLRRHLPTPDVLTAEQRLGSPDGYRSHTLHVEPDGSFSIIALVWRPGQVTRIHDHMTWCVFGVIQGVEHEDLFDAELNAQNRYAILYRLHEAKKPQTRARRLAKFVAMLEAGETIHR